MSSLEFRFKNKNRWGKNIRRRVSNCVKHLLILVSTINSCISISAFASFIASSAVGITLCVITAGIKKYEKIIRKKKKKHDKIVLLRKDKLNTIELLISRALIDYYISHDEFVSINNVLREYNEIKTSVEHTI